MRSLFFWIKWTPFALLALLASSCQHASWTTMIHPHVVNEPVPTHYCPFPQGNCSVCSTAEADLQGGPSEGSVQTSTDLESVTGVSSEVEATSVPAGAESSSAAQVESDMSKPELAEAKDKPNDKSSDMVEPVWNRIMGREKMVIGVKADAPPFGVLRDDGQFWGFEVDLAMALGQHLNVEVELVPVSAKQRAPFLLQDKVDLVMATMTMTQKREEVVDFSIPYFEVGQGLITHADATIQNFQDLKGKRVAVLEGTQAFHTLRRIQPDCFLVIVDSYSNGIDQVLNKDVDALCSDHLLLMGLLNDHPGMALLSLVEETFAPDPYAIAMRENESTLRDNINEALMKFWEEGIWQDTYETWFGMGSMYGHDLMFRIDMLPK